MNKLLRYGLNIGIAIDQLCNAILLGDPDETISSRMAKYVVRGRGFIPCFICKLLDYIEKDHCKKWLEKDEGKDAVGFSKQ